MTATPQLWDLTTEGRLGKAIYYGVLSVSCETSEAYSRLFFMWFETGWSLDQNIFEKMEYIEKSTDKYFWNWFKLVFIQSLSN